MNNYMDYIAIDPNIMLGKPVIKGTRITVESILEELASGKDNNDLLKAYPRLNNEAIAAALAFAADALKGEKTYPLAV